MFIPDFEIENVSSLPIPSHIQVEIQTLSLLLKGKGLHIVSKLEENHFSTQLHQLIFKTIQKAFQATKRTDLITVSDALVCEDFEPFGGLKEARYTLNEITRSDVLNDERLLFDALERNRKRRFLFDLFQESAYRISNGEMPDIVAGSVQTGILESVKHDYKTVFNGNELADILEEEVYKKLNNENGIIGIPSSFYYLDNALKGFQKGHYVVLAARPSIGKTTLALQFALEAVLTHNQSVMIFSLEMTVFDLMNRVNTIYSGGAFANSSSNYGLTGTQKLLLQGLKEKLKNSNLTVNHCSNSTIEDIWTSILKQNIVLQSQGKPNVSFVVIDYIGLIRESKKHRDANEKISHISRCIKNMANELNVCVLTLAQLNRGVESREDKRPFLSDLRDSGSIEQDADSVLMLYREDYQDTGSNGNANKKGEIIIRKNRHGQIGVQLLEQNAYGVFKAR